jgi:hypothetical protein
MEEIAMSVVDGWRVSLDFGGFGYEFGFQFFFV